MVSYGTFYVTRTLVSSYRRFPVPRQRVKAVRQLQSSALTAGISSPSSALQSADVLETYRGLVQLGKIKYDENQVRVLMQLRRLHRELKDYAPPALTSCYTEMTRTYSTNKPWWAREQEEGLSANVDHTTALTRVKTHAEDLAGLTTPKGLLITGPPGSGKSFLVDLWYNTLPTPYRARKHYNELVLEVYRGVWEETQYRMSQSSVEDKPAVSLKQPWTRSIRNRWLELLGSGALPQKWAHHADSSFPHHPTNSMRPTIAFVVAQRLLLQHWLLVFDEIQLLDVSSATLLADVLSWYWRMGGIIVGTSNKVPEDLYKNGVQSDRLEPFVDALKARCPVIELNTKQDWRKVRASGGLDSTWFTGQTEDAFMRCVNDSVKGCSEPLPQSLNVFGRTLDVPWSVSGVCKFTFQQLCDESLGSADYLTLASTFHTVAITFVPILRLANKNQARRFISLIDALYEARCRLICLAETEPGKLFFPDDIEAKSNSNAAVDIDVLLAEAVGETRDLYRPNVSSYDAPNMRKAPPVAKSSFGSSEGLETLSIFSGKDEQFAYKRAVSRLLDMTSKSYAQDETWTPLPITVRKWEKTSGGNRDSAVKTADITSRRPQDHVSRDERVGDFAAEAAYEGTVTATNRRPEAPRVREEHVWGVREDWGEKAGHWGRGASANDRKGSTHNGQRRGSL